MSRKNQYARMTVRKNQSSGFSTKRPGRQNAKILCFLVEILLLSDYPNGHLAMEPQRTERTKDYFNPKEIIHRTGMQRLPTAGFSLFWGRNSFGRENDDGNTLCVFDDVVDGILRKHIRFHTCSGYCICQRVIRFT